MRQRRILMLGGAMAQIPSIIKAKEMGLYVITCDYLPDNPGHKFADEYHNVSTTDQEGVLALAKTLNLDGVLCYASDPSAPAAAYVAEKLGLPGSPYRSVEILTHKDQFRRFLAEHGFHTPRAEGFDSIDEARKGLSSFRFPVMVKPTDSAGSKGVSKLTDPALLEKAFNNARSYSREQRVIIEEYVEKDGCQVAGDGFSVDGKLVFRCFMDDHFCEKNSNPYVPVAASCPMNRPPEVHQKIHNEIQRLLSLLKMGTQAYNFDIRVDQRGEVWLMEVGPRNGGNMIPQEIRYATGVDLVEWSIRAALGEDCSALTFQPCRGFHAYYALHSHCGGIFKGIRYSSEFKPHILEEHLNVVPGDRVTPFTGSNGTLGVLLLQFDSMEQMLRMIREIETLHQVEVE